MYFLKISHRCFHWSSVSRFHASSWTHARRWRLSHRHLQYDRQFRWVKLTSRALMKQQLLFRAGQKQSIAEGKAQKSYGHNQSSADKEACDPVFPPIRPGKADYSIPGLSLSLCHPPSTVAGGQGLLFLEMCVHVIWLVLFNASEEWATIVTVWPFSVPLSGPVFDLKWQSFPQ